MVSSSSLIDMREELEFRERAEERLVKDVSREGMGVGTFSAEGSEVRVAFGVCGSSMIRYMIIVACEGK